VPVVDNHTHLDVVLAETDAVGWRPRSDQGPPADDVPLTIADHLQRAAAVGVTRVLQVGCDLPAVAWTDRAVSEHPAMLGGVAIHPNEAVLHAGVREVAPDGLDPEPKDQHAVSLDDAIARVAAVAAANPRIRVIGETGLDHFRAGERGRAVQRDGVPGAHRPGKGARPRPADPRPGCARRRARRPGGGRRAGAHGLALLLR